MIKRHIGLAVVTVSFTVLHSVALGAGYEKTALWSAKSAGVASAVSASVTGADSLYFNPAGLGSEKGFNLNVHFSPTLSKFKGPISTTTALESKQGFLPIGGILASFSPMEKLGIGAGFYIAGGSTVKYEGVDFSSYSATFTTTQTIESKIQMYEGSIGAGYELIEGLKVGAAWRMTMVNAALSSTIIKPLNAAGTHKLMSSAAYADLKQNKFDGFRLGVQYAPKESCWGVGVAYRSKSAFKVKGTSTFTGKSNVLGDITATASTVELESQLPQALNVGGYIDLMDKKLRLLPEYQFIDYGSVRQLVFTGSQVITAPVALASTNVLPNIDQNWKPQHALRLGAEYSGLDIATLRAGYGINTKVTPTDRARATFVAPGTGHSIIVGAGTTFMEKKLGLDVAADYSFSKGDGVNELGNAGSFSATGMTAHLSLSYQM